MLRKHFVSAWGKRDVRDVTQRQVLDVLKHLVETDRPSEANHAAGVIKTLFGWCCDGGLLAINPCERLKKPAKKMSRERVLVRDELKAVWRSFDADGYPFGTMGKLLLLTGQRRGEVVGMRWSELDEEARAWTIPAARSKNGRTHVVPLSDAAMRTLQAIPRLSSDCLFPARGNDENTVSGFTRAKLRFDRVSGVDGWTFHDLRRTVATGMAEIGVTPHVIERILNHVSGSFAGVAGIYNRFQYLPEMRQALETWAHHIESIVGELRR